MSAFRDPPRILDSAEDVPSFLREGLEAERSDPGPDAAHLHQLGERFGGSHHALPPSTPSGWAWSRLLTLAGAGLLAVAVVVVETRSDHGRPAPATTRGLAAVDPASPPPQAPTREVPSAGEPPREVAPVRPDELPSAAAPPRRGPRAAASSAPARPAASEGAEIDLLARAHEALRARPAETLTLCAKHEAEFSGGRFTQEREALAIEALLYLGRRDEAERRWAGFQQRYPRSNHRTHLADLFSSPSPSR